MEKDIGKKITILPFQHISAFSDIDTGEIFVNQSFIDNALEENVAHELSHIISCDPDHSFKFIDQLNDFGYQYNNFNDLFKTMRRRCGIKSSIAANIGNVSGIQNILTDYHLLQAYRKFSQKILGTEGHWEVINEGTSNVTGDSLSAKDQLIRLYPTPKGAFPVVVLYIPVVNHFRSPQARQLCYNMMCAEAKICVGMSRRKISGMPTPDGGSISYDGSDLVQEGEKMKENILKEALDLGEPLSVYVL